MVLSAGDCRPATSPHPWPVLVFHCYLSVPLAPSNFGMLYGWVNEKLIKSVNHWIIFVDQRCDNSSVLCHRELIPNSNVAFLLSDNYEGCVSNIVRHYTGQYSDCPGTIVLIATKESFPQIQELKQLGWKLVIFHPPGTGWELTAIGHEAHELPVHAAESKEDLARNVVPTWPYGRLIHRVSLPKQPQAEPMKPLDKTGLEQFLCSFSATTMSPDWRGSYPTDIVFQESLEDFICQVLGQTVEQTVTGILKDMVCCKVYDRMTAELNKALAPIGTGRKKKTVEEAKTETVETEEVKQKETEAEKKPEAEMNTDKVTLQLKPKKNKAKSRPFSRKVVYSSVKTPQKRGFQCPTRHSKMNEKERCPHWHPRGDCDYYPKCRTMAELCGYRHPYCADDNGPCTCSPSAKDPQLNHNVGQFS